MTLKEFRSSLNGKDAEGEIIKTIFLSLLTSLVTLGILYYLKLRYVSDFIPKYGFALFFTILSYALILPAVRQVRAYKEFSCMSGMMIGMTIGMIAGFLPGFFIGSTNGMFYGSVFGMAIGILFGAWNGLCCGVMGFMEGIMAGFMGGLMGAMSAVMMLNDNLKIAGVIVFIICAVILFGLKYMVFTESRQMERKHKDSEMFIILWSFVLTVITIWLMVFGPKSGLFL